jgi:hypothetical protein
MLRAVIALLVLLVPSVAQAEGRLAMLIGNQAYNPKVGPLKTRATTSLSWEPRCARSGSPLPR